MDSQFIDFWNEGLNSTEVIKKKAIYGENRLPEKKGRSTFMIYISQFKNPLIYIISLAAIISLLLEQYEDTFIIICVILLDTVIGFFQEYKAEQTMVALRNLLKPIAKVIRDGKILEISTTELVPEDIVIINQGDKFPSDGILIESLNLSVNEAILTGESEAIVKATKDLVYMGTTALSGRGVMKVVNIGTKTELGKIATSLSDIGEEETPLQLKLENFGKSLTYIVILISLSIFAIGVILKFNIFEMIRMSVVLAIAAIPEGLIIAVTMILAIGMRKILQKNGLVKKLLAVETLGSVSTICTDKTGTLTEGNMQVVRSDFKSEKMAAYAMALCNNLEDSLEIQLWNYVQTLGEDSERLTRNFKRIHEIPFSSDYKFMLTTNQIDGEEVSLIKGAPDIVLEFCTIEKGEKTQIYTQLEEWAGSGLKLLGLAYKKDGNIKEVEGFTWIGLIGFEDPIRPSVKEAIALCQRAGIKVKIITGDYQRTAIKVASNLGLSVGQDKVISGEEVEKLSDTELLEIVEAIIIFYRVTPQHKLRIVTALQKCGEITAMIGDGVNDAPALKKANIGVSVGGATDVAQETASLILLDHNFKTLVDSVEEGRIVFDNIKKVVSFVLSNSFAEIFTIFGSFILGWPTPLTIAQILWIHLICDGPSDVALGFERGEKGIMDEPPRRIDENILDAKGKVLIASISTVSALLCLSIYGYFHLVVGNQILGSTLVFAILGIQSLIYIFSFRSLRLPIFKSGNFLSNKPLVFSVVLGISQILIGLYFPFFSDILNVTPLYVNDWIIVISVSFLMIFIVEMVKYFDHRRNLTSPYQNIITNIRKVEEKLPEIHNLHNITLDIMEDKTLIQFHFNIPAETTLEIAHEVARGIENLIVEEIPQSIRKSIEIISHIEPVSEEPRKIHSHPTPTPSRSIREIIQASIKEIPEIKNWGRETVLQDNGNTSISIVIYLDGNLNINQVHDYTEKLETILRRNIPSLKRCIIHSEPLKEFSGGMRTSIS
ncbi:MAG: HAD family hydrolase [Candidatus Heimdallarchaeota archaeon]|nr:HAD family hydrolase [Candidatus Heimdallarchaeota archaeon]